MSLTRQVFKGKDGEYRWRVTAGNNRIIAVSGEGFESKAHAEQMSAALFPEAEKEETEE